jgi:RNA polymerase sigma factor (sigma-70 family)
VVLGYLRGRGALDPEDLLGEVFVSIVRDLPRFEGGEREFRTWSLTIAHRRLVDSWRKGRARPAVPTAPAELAGLGPVSDVETEALARLGTSSAERVLMSLTPDQQEVLLLRIVADMTIEEVARVMGKRPGAVKALQRRALAALRAKISP